MSTVALIPVSEYLASSYSPDREYLAGILVERNVGEKEHSRLQRKLIQYLTRYEPAGLYAWPEQRVRASAERFRIPDVCVTVGEPEESVFTTAPLVCIEVLSPDDTLESLQERVNDYLVFGVPHIWLINPRTHAAYVATESGLTRQQTQLEASPYLTIDLAALFG